MKLKPILINKYYRTLSNITDEIFIFSLLIIESSYFLNCRSLSISIPHYMIHDSSSSLQTRYILKNDLLIRSLIK